VHCIYLQLALKVYVEIIITGFFAIRISEEKRKRPSWIVVKINM